ncbi:MAG: hypothetical protein RIC19_03415 [Phaeodactylibacter sp.]
MIEQCTYRGNDFREATWRYSDEPEFVVSDFGRRERGKEDEIWTEQPEV